MDQTAKTNQDLLLVIDMQNVYTKGQEWACEEVEKASDSILRLLNSRALSQVIFTQYLATKHGRRMERIQQSQRRRKRRPLAQRNDVRVSALHKKIPCIHKKRLLLLRHPAST